MTDTINAASRELTLEPGGSVDINLSAGRLRIRGIEGDRVVVRSTNGAPLTGDVRIDAGGGIVRIRDGEGDIRLGPLHIRTRRSPDLDIDLPRTALISLRTLSGDVVATEIGGASRWATASGDLRISTSAGPVQVETMSGDAVIDASVAIALGARTVSGDLRVRALRLEAIDASSTSGDVRLEAELAVGARHVISSVSGDVEVVTGSPVRLEAQTIAGDIRASGPHRAEGGRGRRTIVVGNGSVALSVRTTSGDVQLKVLGVPIPVASAIELPSPVVPVAASVPAPRPFTEEDTQAWSAPESVVDGREAARLDVLRALERGDLDIETASRRLEALEDAGPRSFRGWF